MEAWRICTLVTVVTGRADEERWYLVLTLTGGTGEILLFLRLKECLQQARRQLRSEFISVS